MPVARSRPLLSFFAAKLCSCMYITTANGRQVAEWGLAKCVGSLTFLRKSPQRPRWVFWTLARYSVSWTVSVAALAKNCATPARGACIARGGKYTRSRYGGRRKAHPHRQRWLSGVWVRRWKQITKRGAGDAKRGKYEMAPPRWGWDCEAKNVLSPNHRGPGARPRLATRAQLPLRHVTARCAAGAAGDYGQNAFHAAREASVCLLFARIAVVRFGRAEGRKSEGHVTTTEGAQNQHASACHSAST